MIITVKGCYLKSLNDGAKRNRLLYLKIMYTAIRKNLTFVINLVTFLASKLIQHVTAVGSIKNLDTGSYFAITLVNFLAN